MKNTATVVVPPRAGAELTARLDPGLFHNADSEDNDPRDTLASSIRYAARLATLLAVTPHRPSLDELLKELILGIEHLWLVVDEAEEVEL